MAGKYAMSVSQFLQLSKSGSIDPDDFYAALFGELKKLQKDNYFVTISEDAAMAQIKNLQKGIFEHSSKSRERAERFFGCEADKKAESERTRTTRSDLKLQGLPVSVKDNICTKGIRTTAGSKILEGYIPPFDATCIERAKKQGGVIIGKTVQDEFGFGTFSVNSAYGIPKNPLDTTRSCGGSSGGAGGITAALDFPHIAIAESTGGSISCPAAFCGVYGLTPTYGRVSRYGLIDFASSLDKIGVIGKSVEDVALMFSIIAGHDKKDSTSIADKVEDASNLEIDLRKVKVGVPKEFFGKEIDEKVKNAVWDRIKQLESAGAKYEECSLPNTKFSIPAYYTIAMAEASTNLAKFCGMRYGAAEPLEGDFNEYFAKVRGKYFGEEAKRRIILGTYARMAGYRDQYYLKALKVRQLIINDYKKTFKKFDVLVSPTMPFIAPKFSEIEKLSPVEHYYADILTGSPNVAGIPMLSVPAGKADGMPVGMHILGDYMKEKMVLSVGKCVR